jgi:hypothetical protein
MGNPPKALFEGDDLAELAGAVVNPNVSVSSDRSRLRITQS